MVEIPRDTSSIPPELLQTLQEAQADEDKLRAYGASEERIRAKVALGRRLAVLAARGVDISAALSAESTDKPAVVDPELSAVEEAEVDRLDAMGIMNIAEAIQRAKNKHRS